MKKNLEILDYDDRNEDGTPKTTAKGVRYTRFRTNEGWMSCFDIVSCGKLKDANKSVVSAEVEQSGNFTNITKCYGEAEELKGNVTSNDKGYDEKPEVVKMGNVKEPYFEEKLIMGSIQAQKDFKINKNTTMYVSYAKDIFCAMKGDYDSFKTRMEEAIALVKQAKEAFE